MTFKLNRSEGVDLSRRVTFVASVVAALTVSVAAGCGAQAPDPALLPMIDLREPSLQSGTLIQLRDGRVQGRTDSHTRSFTGIPYAAPPVGALRWKPPVPVAPWRHVLDATGPGVACPQPGELVGPVVQDEDCLQLNVFAPAEPPGDLLPVMVWFHGGGNIGGSANAFIERDPLLGQGRPETLVYDGAAFRSEGGPDVIVVTVNYRLGPLGFLAHPGLTREEGTSGNYGLMDQRAALRWVKSHIRAFGGDPDRVSLFGQGAGAIDACHQMVATASEDLFDAIVLESGTCVSAPLPELPEAEAAGAEFAAAVGCRHPDASQSLACLRQRATSDLVELDFAGARDNGELAIVDGEFLSEQPLAAITAGRTSHVPAIVGTTSNEAAAFFVETRAIQTDEQYRQLLKDLFGASAAEVVGSHYSLDRFSTPNDAAITVVTDALFACPARRLATMLSDDATVFLYRFALGALVDPFYGLGATHGVELLWVWNVWPKLSPYTAVEVGYAGWLRGYWSALADGDVNATSRPEWPQYSPSSERTLLIDEDGMTQLELPQRAACDMWQAMPHAAPAVADLLEESLDTNF